MRFERFIQADSDLSADRVTVQAVTAYRGDVAPIVAAALMLPDVTPQTADNFSAHTAAVNSAGRTAIALFLAGSFVAVLSGAYALVAGVGWFVNASSRSEHAAPTT